MYRGYECYRAMSDMEQIRWKNNVVKAKLSISHTLLKDYYNFIDFVESSFVWSETKQGNEYWANIAERYKLHDLLTPTKNFTTKPPKTF